MHGVRDPPRHPTDLPEAVVFAPLHNLAVRSAPAGSGSIRPHLESPTTCTKWPRPPFFGPLQRSATALQGGARPCRLSVVRAGRRGPSGRHVSGASVSVPRALETCFTSSVLIRRGWHYRASAHATRRGVWNGVDGCDHRRAIWATLRRLAFLPGCTDPTRRAQPASWGPSQKVEVRSYETLVPNRHPLGVGGDPRSLCRSGVTRMSLMGLASHGRRSDYATTRNAFRHPSAPRTPPPLRDGSCAVACDGDGDARSSSHTTEPTCKRASMYDCRIDRTAPHG